MMKIDAHMHLPIKAAPPFACLRGEIRQNELEGLVLILNTEQEQDAFFSGEAQALSDEIQLGVAVLASPHEKIPSDCFSRLEALKIPKYCKIYPRLSDIQREDFPATEQMLAKLPVEVAIVDCFSYGPAFQSHTGIELTIYLAQKFPQKTFVMAHAGGVRLLEAMLYAKPLTNIYFEVSFTANYLFDSSVHMDMVHLLKHCSDRVLFGSDFPEFSSLQAFENVCILAEEASLSLAQRQKLFYDTAHRIYFT